MQNMLMHNSSGWLWKRGSVLTGRETTGPSPGIGAAMVSDMSKALSLTLLHIPDA